MNGIRVEPSTDFRIGGTEALESPSFGGADAATGNSSAAVDFSSILARGVEEANQLQIEAGAKVDALAKGQSDDLHGAMITSKEADISLKLVGTVRNRLLDAFHELWRINL